MRTDPQTDEDLPAASPPLAKLEGGVTGDFLGNNHTPSAVGNSRERADAQEQGSRRSGGKQHRNREFATTPPAMY